MAFSISPAVTVREIDLTSNIPAVASTKGGIAGSFSWGPVREATLITSELELAEVFGKPNDSNFETFFTAADFLSYSNQLYVVRVANGASKSAGSVTVSNTASYNFEAIHNGTLGNSIKISYVSGATEYSQSMFSVGEMDEIVANTNIFNTSTISFRSSTSFSTTLNAGDVIKLGNTTVGYQNLVLSAYSITPVANTGTFTYSMTFKTKYILAETSIEDLSMSREWAYAYLFGKKPRVNSCHFVVADRLGNITGTVDNIIERYDNLSLSTTGVRDDGTNNYYRTVINGSSSWIVIPDVSSELITDEIGYVNLTSGSNGSSETDMPFSKITQGYDEFTDGDELGVSLLMQGKTNSGPDLANYIIGNICEVRKDYVFFISPSKDTQVNTLNVPIANKNAILTDMIAFRNDLQSSSYWFLDSGYKYRYDKYNDVYRWVPLNGDMAGLASRTDPWESFAGYKRGIIKNVVKLAYNPNKAQRDELYSNDINPVISQPGQGTLLFGDKTGLGRSSAFDHVNVRRLFISIEKAIATASESLLFEINDEFLQTEFRNMVEPFLRDIKGRRGITDFSVVCDGRVNTPDIIDQNVFRANIFLKPARSINEIQLNFVAARTGISFEEIIGQQF